MTGFADHHQTSGETFTIKVNFPVHHSCPWRHSNYCHDAPLRSYYCKLFRLQVHVQMVTGNQSFSIYHFSVSIYTGLKLFQDRGITDRIDYYNFHALIIVHESGLSTSFQRWPAAHNYLSLSSVARMWSVIGPCTARLRHPNNHWHRQFLTHTKLLPD